MVGRIGRYRRCKLARSGGEMWRVSNPFKVALLVLENVSEIAYSQYVIPLKSIKILSNSNLYFLNVVLWQWNII
jgi:hypothetical protein